MRYNPDEDRRLTIRLEDDLREVCWPQRRGGRCARCALKSSSGCGGRSSGTKCGNGMTTTHNSNSRKKKAPVCRSWGGPWAATCESITAGAGRHD